MTIKPSYALILLAIALVWAPAAWALTPDEETNIKVYEEYAPAVVNIVTTTVNYDFFYNPVPNTGSGSGVLIDRAGHILTSYHVVEGARRLDVTLYDGTRYEARIVGVDPGDDIAVVRIKAPKSLLKPVVMGDSAGLKVGQKVLAIGNPFGLDKTLTVGIVSSLGRMMRAVNGRLIGGIIQTDAAINPGNSGGPLLDGEGRMVGLNTAIFSPVGGSVGIGFAIPVNTVKKVLPELLEKGYVTRPWLGITGQSIGNEVAVVLGYPGAGILVADVFQDSPAARAGLKGANKTLRVGNLVISGGGDFIIAIDGRAVASMDELNAVMDTRSVGESISLSVVRDGRRVRVGVRLEELPLGR